MTLLDELTAPVERAQPEHKTPLIDRVLQQSDDETAEAIRAALLSKIDARTLSIRLRERGWPISQDMIQRWRRENA